jgi:predicted N-acetyltransferase YhbS
LANGQGAEESIRLRPRGEGDDFSRFNSGDHDLDEFIRDDAAPLEARDVTRVYVAEAGSVLVGYIALVADTLVLKSPERKRMDLGRAPKNVPAIKIGRLAVSTDWQERGIGSALIDLAYQRAVRARASVGCRLLTVDAYPAKEDWYSRRGFIRNKSGTAEDKCERCGKPLVCHNCTGAASDPSHKTVSMRFDLKTDPLPAWATVPPSAI